MKLKQHIEKEHGGNQAAFARSIGVNPQQVTRWLNYNCIWFEGAVYKKQSKAVREEFKLNKGKDDG